MTPEEFQRRTDVSRETLERLRAYGDLLAKWQRTVNLVSRNSLVHLWQRHMFDSAQLMPLVPRTARTLFDIGSGGGFPGMVLAIMGMPEVHLVEADERKCAFLREAGRIAGLRGTRLTIHNQRIEDVDARPADVITARALAPLGQILAYSEPFIGISTVCVFPKGANLDVELTEAAKGWRMTLERHRSVTDRRATILRLSHVSRR